MRPVGACLAILFVAALAHAQPACKPLDTRSPNARGQVPAFPGQTRACAAKPEPFQFQVITRGLDTPWAVEPLPDGSFLITERPGRLRIVSAGGIAGPNILGVPKVHASGQGGLLDVALSPGFETDRTIYLSYSEPRQNGNGTSVARAVLSRDRSQLEDVRVIFRAMPTYSNSMHYGSRIVFGPDGLLYVTLGERSDRSTRPQAQQLDSHFGKVVRIKPDGGVPEGNPFAGQAGALPETWTLGHRNIQAAAFDARGRLWTIEHGPQGGDELNLIEKGKNYGWPVQSYGQEYSGSPIDGAVTNRPGVEQPVYYWDPVIAPSGAQFHSGKGMTAWKGNLFVGGLGSQALVRLVLEGDRVVAEEHLLGEWRQRVRDVREGPDGSLYIVTDSRNGELWRVSAKR